MISCCCNIKPFWYIISLIIDDFHRIDLHTFFNLITEHKAVIRFCGILSNLLCDWIGPVTSKVSHIIFYNLWFILIRNSFLWSFNVCLYLICWKIFSIDDGLCAIIFGNCIFCFFVMPMFFPCISEFFHLAFCCTVWNIHLHIDF